MFINFPEINDLMIQDREVTIPKMVTIRQHFDTYQIADIPLHIREQMEENA